MAKDTKKRLRSKADKLWYNTCLKLHNNKCELTDQTFALQVHHFFPRSCYPMLRYDLENGIVLKKGLHFNHHQKGDPTVHQRIIELRGKDWYDKLLKRSHLKLRNSYTTIGYYEKIIKGLEKALKD